MNISRSETNGCDCVNWDSDSDKYKPIYNQKTMLSK